MIGPLQYAYVPEALACKKNAGLTDVEVGFREVYYSSTQAMSVQERIDARSGYAEFMIKGTK